jgi:hypothetical protein
MEQSILNNNIEARCKCCDQVWLTLLGHVTPDAYLFASGFNGDITIEVSLPAVGAPGGNLAWQEYSMMTAFVGSDINNALAAQIGDSNNGITIVEGTMVRVKNVDTKGCTHYSNAIQLFS